MLLTAGIDINYHPKEMMKKMKKMHEKHEAGTETED
jgi:cytochrome c-type biogenesis protein CcmE